MKKLCLSIIFTALAASSPVWSQVAPQDARPATVVSSPEEVSVSMRYAVLEQQQKDAGTARERADLEAQQSMARSAKQLLQPSWWQVWIGALGLIGLLASLSFTYWSMAQTRAALHSQQTTAELQTRAYVGNNGITISDFEVGKSPVARINLKNFGTTPAYKLKERTKAKIVPKGGALVFEAVDWASQVTINPTDISVSASRLPKLTQDQFDRFTGDSLSESDVLLVTGEVAYESIGKTRTTRYAIAFWGEKAARHQLIAGENWSD